MVLSPPGAVPVKHNPAESNGVTNGGEGGSQPHHSEREDMKFWENDHFRDLRKRWEKGEMDEGEIA